MHNIIFYVLEFSDVETILYREPNIYIEHNINWTEWQSWKIPIKLKTHKTLKKWSKSNKKLFVKNIKLYSHITL